METKPVQADRDSENVQLDKAVISKLPPGCKVLSVSPSGESQWVDTAMIVVQFQDGGKVNFFKKSAGGAAASAMMKGTFEAEQALYTFVPGQVPKPIACGAYINDPSTNFYLCDFVEMNDDVPTTRGWASTVSALHLKSMGKSPTGQFGFYVTTHLANVPVNNTWQSTWEAFWKQQMESLFDREKQLHEPDEENESLKLAYLDSVIPRYLRPLESNGKSITPCLIHSDLWPGNIKPKSSSNELCIFDACAYWGHNEGLFPSRSGSSKYRH
ncbi:hypothetical protein QQZ08_002771 [Neonectria magnoliae]|uniref:protein-ribulosamine 3-kinase n=1 Tax=Neonectria magnoliae TaxID=2732573 RepID=A0ABR1ID44_9HYPO